MGLRDKARRKPKEPQGILPFEYETTGEPEDVTARAGLPLVVETMLVLGVRELVQEHVPIRQRQSGYSEADHVEALLLMLAAGGECLDDRAVLGADRGLLELLGKSRWPSADASRQCLLAFHDEALLEKARQTMAPGESALLAPESAPLQGLGRVLAEGVSRLQLVRPAKVATLELDATCIESRKREAMALYEGGRGYQPEVVFTIPAKVLSHARRVWARVARVLSDACELLGCRRRLRAAHELLRSVRATGCGAPRWRHPAELCCGLPAD